MNISLKQLHVFRAVATERNFSRAGELIGLTQPAVSRAITELETQINLRLFDRTTRDVRLTQAGQILAQRLPRWIDELENTLNELHSWASNRTGKVRIASSPTLSAALMPHCLAYSAQQEPGLQIILVDRIQQNVLSSILSGEVDFGIIVEPDAAHLRELHCETLLTDPFVVVCPEHHPLVQAQVQTLPHAQPQVQALPQAEATAATQASAGTTRQQPNRRIHWPALNNTDLILLDQASGSRRLIDELLLQQRIKHRVVQQVGHVTTGFEMVRAGLGINIVPSLAIPETGLPGLAILWPTPATHRNIMLARQKNKTLAPLAEALWSLVKTSTENTLHRRAALGLAQTT